jgi:hypothetical protein
MAETDRVPQPFRGRRVGLRYDPAEDRLLLTLTDAAGNHRSFWLTRRIALGLAGLARQEAERLAMQAAVASKPRGGGEGPVVHPATAKAPAQAEAARQAARLLTRVRVRRPKAGCVLAFEAEGEAPALLALDDAALGRFQGLVDGLARRAQWVAPTGATTAEKPEGPPAASRPKRRLH